MPPPAKATTPTAQARQMAAANPMAARGADGLSRILMLAPAIACLIIYYANDGEHAFCETDIPLFLVVNGWTSIGVVTALTFAVCLHRRSQAGKEEDKKQPLTGLCLCLHSIGGFFLLSWWIAGNVWVWDTKPCDQAQDFPNCCNRSIWYGARGYLIYTYVTLGLLCCCICLSAGAVASQQASAEMEGAPGAGRV